MEINRNTYESFFLLYIDNELTMEERAQVEAFVASNPDLGMELQMLKETILNPDQSLVFGSKQQLLKESVINPVNQQNYEEYFVQYSDDELSLEEKEYTEQFVYANPHFQNEFELILSIKLSPDNQQVFQNKEILYRTEKDEKVFVMRWWKIAAAAAVLFVVAGTGWYNSESGAGNPQTLSQVPSKSSVSTEPAKANSIVAVPENNSAGNHQPADNIKENVEQAATIQLESDRADSKLASRSIKSEKIISKPGNISTDVNVQLSNNGGMAINTNKIPGVDEAVSKGQHELLLPEPATASLNIPGEEIAQNASANMALSVDPEQDVNSNVIYVANTSVNKKNKLRGILRTASRVFEKTASLQPSGNNRGIRIANFEIGLQ